MHSVGEARIAQRGPALTGGFEQGGSLASCLLSVVSLVVFLVVCWCCFGGVLVLFWRCLGGRVWCLDGVLVVSWGGVWCMGACESPEIPRICSRHPLHRAARTSHTQPKRPNNTHQDTLPRHRDTTNTSQGATKDIAKTPPNDVTPAKTHCQDTIEAPPIQAKVQPKTSPRHHQKT